MTARPHGEVLAFVLVAAVAAAASSGVRPDSPAPSPPVRVISSGPACPLTLADEHKASLAFEEMMPVLMHPRCFNCHGGVNEKLSYEQGGHMGDSADPEDCKDCHVGVRNMARGNRLESWTTPVSAFFFKGKSSLELCNQFKTLEPNPAAFVAHMVNDKGAVQFGEAAFRGDRNLNKLGREISREKTGREFVAEPPPFPLAELVGHARNWANTVGTAGWKIPDCGCRLSGQVWTGKISMVFTMRDKGFGTLTERLESNVRFELDSSYIINAPGDSTLYWKTASGTLNWSVIATGGECTTIKGSFTRPNPAGETRWVWELNLVR